MRTKLAIAIFLSGLFVSATSFAQLPPPASDDDDDVLDMFEEEEEEEAAEEAPGVSIRLNGEFTNLFLWRSDRDFDPLVPSYEEEGQTVGEVSTYFRPQLSMWPAEKIRIYYESELGLNVWSRNDPDQYFAAANNYMVYKHRELYTEFDLDVARFKVGYQRLQDPTDLFLSHWMGAATLEASLGNIGIRLFVGQLPDTTFEGMMVDDNNFIHDNITWGVDGEMYFLQKRLKVAGGFVGVHDDRITHKPLILYTPFLGIEYSDDFFHGKVYGMMQAGKWENSGVARIDQEILAWAATANVGVTTRCLDADWNVFVLSADDEHDGNRQFGAFFYSGKNHSRSMLLTEDELRDRYDNYDEQMSTNWGSFFVNRAGLVVTDITVSGKGMGGFHPELVVAGGFTLEDHNSNGNRYMGVEADIVLAVDVLKIASLVAVGQLFFPGEAAAAYVNRADLQATDSIYGVQFGTVVKW